MKLREKQSYFVKLVGMLIQYTYQRGYELTFGDAYAKTGHMKDSLHYSRLAIDLNLFVGGEWISGGDHPAWKDLGEFWEHLDDRCAWGGRFGDANHFSLKHGGRQ